MTGPRLSDRVVIVTGASSGIGAAIARRCLQEGAIVVASGRREALLHELGQPPGGRLIVHVADLTEAGATDRLVAAAAQAGPVRGLVHAAGTVWRGEDPRRTTQEQLRTFLDENLVAGIELAGATYAEMAENGDGSIVLVGSQLAHVGAPGYETYSAAKGGVTAFARALAAEAGAHNVRVNVLAPGLVRTPMAYVDRENFDELAPAVAERHPLRRIGEPDDLAGPAVFLLSDDAGWVTGHTLIVDGGFTAV
jgi:NAD(P)-dependent dehydrogenase (short-subunit alcohol dehydrogenase family)